MSLFCCVEVHGTENPFAKRPALDASVWQESARKQHLNERKAKMKTNQLEDPRTQKVFQVRLTKFLQLLFFTIHDELPHSFFFLSLKFNVVQRVRYHVTRLNILKRTSRYLTFLQA